MCNLECQLIRQKASDTDFWFWVKKGIVFYNCICLSWLINTAKGSSGFQSGWAITSSSRKSTVLNLLCGWWEEGWRVKIILKNLCKNSKLLFFLGRLKRNKKLFQNFWLLKKWSLKRALLDLHMFTDIDFFYFTLAKWRGMLPIS